MGVRVPHLCFAGILHGYQRVHSPTGEWACGNSWSQMDLYLTRVGQNQGN